MTKQEAQREARMLERSPKIGRISRDFLVRECSDGDTQGWVVDVYEGSGGGGRYMMTLSNGIDIDDFLDSL